MTLNPNTKHPSARSYVLKLRFDAAPSPGELAGRLENMASGRHFDFTCGEELLAALVDDIRS